MQKTIKSVPLFSSFLVFSNTSRVFYCSNKCKHSLLFRLAYSFFDKPYHFAYLWTFSSFSIVCFKIFFKERFFTFLKVYIFLGRIIEVKLLVSGIKFYILYKSLNGSPKRMYQITLPSTVGACDSTQPPPPNVTNLFYFSYRSK